MRTDLTGSGGIRLAADVDGAEDGPTVVLLHGGGQTRHSWSNTWRFLADSGWRAWTVDMRGHGDSEWDGEGDYTLQAFAADAEAIARSIPQPPVLVGASLGGLSSMVAIAQADPQEDLARALVLVDVAHRLEADGRDRIGALLMHRFTTLKPHKEALRRALATLAMPQNAATGAKLAWRSADRIWRLAGDTATDYNHYTKRAMLIGVYASTSLIFLDDDSDDLAATRAFLDRRIGNVMQVEKAKAALTGRGSHRPSLSRFLGRLRYPAR